jgi:stage II sporulation protein D
MLPAALVIAACASAPPSAPPAAPQPAAPSARSSNALTPVAAPAKNIAGPRIRVGMLSDQASVTFPRVKDGYFIISDSGPSSLRRGFSVNAPLRDAAVRYGVQVASISDRPSATGLGDRIRTETGQRVDMVFDPSAANGGLYRILAGDFTDTQSAQPFREQLTKRGYGKDMLIVRRPSDQPFEQRLEIVDDEGDRYTIGSASILVMPASGETVTIGEKPYRTAARVLVNARGLLNVLNELNLEDYLRGVVPAEMGSKIYDELEALKAQAVAARTYAVRNLGQFASEGFDICPGPACQAYKGFSGEELLTDQAVRETAGLVMTFDGRLVDALYTSTCGGETSDVGTMFPGRSEPYLRRARCVELDVTTLAGRADSGMLDETQVNARTFAALAGLRESGSSWTAADVEGAVSAARRLAGYTGTAAAARPVSSRRVDVLAYLATVFALDAAARTLTLPEDRRYYFPQSSANDDAVHQAAAFLIKWGVWPAQQIDRIDLRAAMPRDELYALLGAWVRKHEGTSDVTGRIALVDGRSIAVKNEGKITRVTLPPGIPIYRRLGDRFQEYATVPVMIGDRVVVQQSAQKVPVSAIVVANYDGASFDRTSSYADWTRSFRADDLVKSINSRTPIQQLIDIRPVTVDASHRIAEMEVTAEGGRKFVLRGLPIRWSLNVPDNLFVYEKTKDPDGVDRYTFHGKGWGHGVGMCQTGAYGMAFRGWKFDQILKRYYSGIEIVPMTSVGTTGAASRE